MENSTTSFALDKEYRYIRFSVQPGVNDPLSLRKLLESAMAQSFGLSRAGTYMDVFWIAQDGSGAIIRVGEADAQFVLAAVVALDKPVQLSVVKHSNFLPAITGDGGSWIQAQSNHENACA